MKVMSLHTHYVTQPGPPGCLETRRPKAAELSARYLTEVHGAVLPAAAVAAVDTTLAVLAVEVSWSRMRRRQQTCRDGKMFVKGKELRSAVTETTSGRAFMVRKLSDDIYELLFSS